MDVRRDIKFADFVFFQMGSENYNQRSAYREALILHFPRRDFKEFLLAEVADIYSWFVKRLA